VRREDANRYRRLVRRSVDPDRAIVFLRKVQVERPRSSAARIQLALSLMDRVPCRDLGVVQRGRLSSEALALLDPILEAQPDAWGAAYLAGTIHLGWFTKKEHLPRAIQILERALASARGPHRALVLQSLGDALVKDNRFIVGRRYWQDGEKEFPDDKGIKDRMGLTSLMVDGYVERAHSWETAQDTDLLSEVAGDLPDLPASESPESGN
jgi:hypothetical protein